MRMHPRRGEHALERLGELERAAARLRGRSRRSRTARRPRPSAPRPRRAGSRSTRNRWQWVSTAPRCTAQFRVLVAHRDRTMRVSAFRRYGELHVKHGAGNAHPGLEATAYAVSRRGKSASPFVRRRSRRQTTPRGRLGQALRPEGSAIPSCDQSSPAAPGMTGEIDTARIRSVSADAYRIARHLVAPRRRPSRASTAPSRRGTRSRGSRCPRSPRAPAESPTAIRCRRTAPDRVGGHRGQVGLGPDHAASGTTPSKDVASIASTRLARFPSPFARSALWRSVIDSQEKLPSWPNVISRMK